MANNINTITKKHLYQDRLGRIHECEAVCLVGNDRNTYTVWTKCSKDVPTNGSYKSYEVITCNECIETILSERA